jgi:hypothetical protein
LVPEDKHGFLIVIASLKREKPVNRSVFFEMTESFRPFYPAQTFFNYMKNKWFKNTTPEYRKPTWIRNDLWNGGTVERHEDCLGRNVYVRRNAFGNVTQRSKPKWGSDGGW